jgi:hypothetical protein
MPTTDDVIEELRNAIMETAKRVPQAATGEAASFWAAATSSLAEAIASLRTSGPAG